MFVLATAHYKPRMKAHGAHSGPRPTNGPEDRAPNPAHLVGWVGLGYGLCGLLRGQIQRVSTILRLHIYHQSSIIAVPLPRQPYAFERIHTWDANPRRLRPPPASTTWSTRCLFVYMVRITRDLYDYMTCTSTRSRKNRQLVYVAELGNYKMVIRCVNLLNIVEYV